MNNLDLVRQYWELKSRQHFGYFREYMNYPLFKKNWFVRELCSEYQIFYEQLLNNEKPILCVQVHPQIGKSETTIDFAAWLLGKMPNLKVIYSSYSEMLGARANKRIQRFVTSEKYKGIFNTRLPGRREEKAANSSLIEFVNNNKCLTDNRTFRNTTVAGAITGETLDLGIIDDAHKNHEEANSATIREKIWNWFQADFYTRFSENAGLIIIMTRWHSEDILGRFLELPQAKRARVVSYKAIAHEDEKYRKKGEAVFPQQKSAAFLKDRKSMMHPDIWSALYDQAPISEAGSIFRSEWWKYWDVLPMLRYKFITADTAQKEKTRNDYSVLQCWGAGIDGNLYMLDQKRGKWTAPELERRAKAFYFKHNTKRKRVAEPTFRSMYIEDKSSGIGLIQHLREKKLSVTEVPRDKDKITRAYDASPYVMAGKVFLNLQVEDVMVITEEAKLFPDATFDDTIDTLMTAIEVTYIKTHGASRLLRAMGR